MSNFSSSDASTAREHEKLAVGIEPTITEKHSAHYGSAGNRTRNSSLQSWRDPNFTTPPDCMETPGIEPEIQLCQSCVIPISPHPQIVDSGTAPEV